jgi:hypothetical protein
MKKAITPPIPLDRWFRDHKSVEELRLIVESNAFQQAIAILKEAAGPSYSTLTPNVDQNNLRLAWFAGYRDALNDLHKLTKLPTKQNQIEPDEWTHIQNP